MTTTANTNPSTRSSKPPTPYTPPDIPPGKINLTDLDSRLLKGPRGRGFLQGYNAQAVANEHQIVIAAEVTTTAPDFGNLEPMLEGLRANGARVLKRALDAARKAGVRAESQLYESMAGPAASIILRDARKWRAELIVMGTHGRRGIRRLVLGSDAEHVLREATVPVLLLRGR